MMMREDFDYISFENYRKDTKELTDQAAHIIGELSAENRRLKQLVGALVHAAGEVEIDPFYTGHDFPIAMEYLADKNVVRYRPELTLPKKDSSQKNEGGE